MNSTDSSVELSEDEFAALQLSPNSVPCVVLKEEGMDWSEEKAEVAAPPTLSPSWPAPTTVLGTQCPSCQTALLL